MTMKKILLITQFILLIMITLCACEKTDELKGTWVLDGAYNLGTGEVISMEQLRTTDANTDILMTFDGLGDYQLEYTDVNGKKLELKDTYKIPENEYELKLGADSSAIPITITSCILFVLLDVFYSLSYLRSAFNLTFAFFSHIIG